MFANIYYLTFIQINISIKSYFYSINSALIESMIYTYARIIIEKYNRKVLLDGSIQIIDNNQLLLRIVTEEILYVLENRALKELPSFNKEEFYAVKAKIKEKFIY